MQANNFVVFNQFFQGINTGETQYTHKDICTYITTHSFTFYTIACMYTHTLQYIACNVLLCVQM